MITSEVTTEEIENGKEPIVAAYLLEGNVYVGIDLKSVFFQVESEDTDKMKAVRDDLFLTRGLSEDNIRNYVIAAQYILLKNSVNSDFI